MSVLIQPSSWKPTPEALAAQVRAAGGLSLLRTQMFAREEHRFSLVTAAPLLTFRTWGSHGEIQYADGRLETRFGNPWEVMAELLGGFEVLDPHDLPYPLGGCFGYWGYDLKQFLEPRLPRRAVHDWDWPDCHLGFYGSLVVFDHTLGKVWIVATGLTPSGDSVATRAREDVGWWEFQLQQSELADTGIQTIGKNLIRLPVSSTFTKDSFMETVRRAQSYIRRGDIYQVNLAQRFTAECRASGWDLHRHLAANAPAPYAAYFDHGGFELVSASPELFLKMNGADVITRPIKGTRPRSVDPALDEFWATELLSSPKERSELVMITDLLRNDLGRICEYGSIGVAELAQLERFAHVQHLVSTVHGRLRDGQTHLAALAACFPGGSITGAPKIRAMEIIDELEPVTRGPYCGCHGYLGFNRRSQLSITIRTAQVRSGVASYYAGAGIVGDSDPEAEYEETLVKAKGWLAI